MSDGLRPKTIRSTTASPKTSQRKRNLRYRAKQKAFRASNKWYQEEQKQRMRYDGQPTFEQQLQLELRLSRDVILAFQKRIGKDLRLRTTHYHLQRRNIKVLDVVEKVLKKPRSYVVLTWEPKRHHHHNWLNKSDLRKLCVMFGVKYWNEMTTKEQMAVMLFLAHWDGIDLEKDAIVGDDE